MSAKTAGLPASFSPNRGDAAAGGASERPSGVVPKSERSDAWPLDGTDERPATHSAPEGPIRAYAKLEFPGFSYYVQTLEVTIGRRPGQLQNGVAAPMRAPQQAWRQNDVDVDLGPLKSISRLHARIFYSAQPHYYRNPMHLSPMMPPSALSDASDSAHGEKGSSDSEGRFLLEVLGRNGAFVDDVWVRMNGVVPLGRRTKIQIAERVFYFVLPPPVATDDDEESHTDASEAGAALSDDASSSELSDVEDAKPLASTTPVSEPPVPKLVLKARSKLSPTHKDKKRALKDTSHDETQAKRRRPMDDSAPLPVGTPIGIETLKPPRGKGSGKGSGKGKGKTDAPIEVDDDDAASVEEVAPPSADASAARRRRCRRWPPLRRRLGAARRLPPVPSSRSPS